MAAFGKLQVCSFEFLLSNTHAQIPHPVHFWLQLMSLHAQGNGDRAHSCAHMPTFLPVELFFVEIIEENTTHSQGFALKN